VLHGVTFSAAALLPRGTRHGRPNATHGTTIMKVYVKSTPSGIVWGTAPSSMASLEVPISTTNQTSVTYEFVLLGPKPVFYRFQNGMSGKLSPMEGPMQEVPVGGKRTCTFSTSSSGTYEPGVVEVVVHSR
jgi:hypothetical protein